MSDLDHFISLANRGDRRDSSGGEKHARQLALAMMHHVSTLDGQAIEGAIKFLHLAKLQPETARDLVPWPKTR